jgi:ribosomal protein S18 acetylase RimI-like enzyme
VARSPGRIHIVDIALLPQQRNRGVGSAILQDLLTEAERMQCQASIHVEQENRARRLYERLGFEPVENRGLYVLMEWRPRRAGIAVR